MNWLVVLWRHRPLALDAAVALGIAVGPMPASQARPNKIRVAAVGSQAHRISEAVIGWAPIVAELIRSSRSCRRNNRERAAIEHSPRSVLFE